MTRPIPCLGLALALSSTAAWADHGPLDPPDLSRYLRWGPMRIRPGLELTNVGRDDNIFLSSGQTPRTSDFSGRLSPRMEGVLLFGERGFLTFKEQLDYTIYQKHSGLNYTNQAGSARVTFPMKRLGFFAEGALNRFKDRPTSELDFRPERREQRLGAGVILDLGWRTDAEISRVRSDWSNRDPNFRSTDPLTGRTFTIGDLLDRVEDGNHLKLRYRLTGSTRVALKALSRRATFDNPDVARDSHEVQVLPGLEFGEGGRLGGALYYGRARLDAKDPTRPDFSGAVGEMKLALRLSLGSRLELDGGRRVGFAVYQGNRYFLDTTYGTRVIHYFNRAVGMEAGGSFGKLTFPTATGVGERIDRITLYELGGRLRIFENSLGRRVEYSLKVSRWERDSNFNVLDQTRSTVGFGAVVGF